MRLHLTNFVCDNARPSCSKSLIKASVNRADIIPNKPNIDKLDVRFRKKSQQEIDSTIRQHILITTNVKNKQKMRDLFVSNNLVILTKQDEAAIDKYADYNNQQR